VRRSHQWVAPTPAARVTLLSAAYPLLAYGMWWLFFSLDGAPQGIRPVALYAMGIPVLAAASGLNRWRRIDSATAAAPS
jgi:hypothetical protein